MFFKTSITPLINKKQIYKCQTFRSTDLHQLSTKENIQTKYNVTPSFSLYIFFSGQLMKVC